MKSRTIAALTIPTLALAIGLAATAEPGPGAGLDDGVRADPPAEQPPLPPAIAEHLAKAGVSPGGSPDDLPKFEDVAKDYEKVVSSPDGKSLYTLWRRDKDGQLLAELPRNFEGQLLFLAYTISGGVPTAGVQSGDMYAKWKRFDKRLALIEPNFAVRTSGDLESKKGHERVFTDRVVLDVPIAAMGPGGGPVIDMDALLLNQATTFFGVVTRGLNPNLATIEKAKAFPENVEVAFTAPMIGGRFTTLHYSIKALPNGTGYKPREADTRIGYFTTTYRDVGDAGADTPWKRYINRWSLAKADPRLKMSPPKEPIIFYLEHTTPVRYRRWVRDGVLEWNKAFEKVGLVNAVEVYQQDASTGAHMDKDPEDARYNFVLWTNANMGFAIGPSRVDPRTGEILDADIVMDEGFINSYVDVWKRLIPEQALEGFGPQTLTWLETRPQWDPRVRLAPPSERAGVIAELQRRRVARGVHRFGPHPAMQVDPTLLGDDLYDGLAGRISQVNGLCQHGLAKSADIALFRMSPDLFMELIQDDDEGEGEEGEGEDEEGDKDDEDEDEDKDEDKDEPKSDLLDGVPDWFIGPLLKEVVMHEVGHTLGLRHNFKASTIRTLAEINTEEAKGQAQVGSVMDYNPININVDDGPVQGDFTTTTIGPYDYWAIEYGYTFDKPEPVLSRVAEDDLPYGTDEDTWGPDPRARRFDYGKDPLDYAESQMRLVEQLREKILDRMVKEGESWAKARAGYQMLLGRHFGAVSIASGWIGGSYVNRDKKGDPGDRVPVTPIEAERQRRALEFVIEHSFDDDAFGLTPELLSHLTVDKWWDEGGFSSIFLDESWEVHDRIAGLQAVALTMMLNPGTLNRVFDSEFHVPADQDAITVPEIMSAIHDAVWTELDARPTKTHTARKPMVSSLRRNLQSEHVERLIDLSLPNASFGACAKAVSNLSVQALRQLEEKLGKTMEKHGSKIDPYTAAHFAEARVRIAKALDAEYIYNTDDLNKGSAMPFFFIQPTPEGRDR